MNDPIVDEVRRVRDAHASRFNYDLDAIFCDIKERRKKVAACSPAFLRGRQRRARQCIRPGPPLRLIGVRHRSRTPRELSPNVRQCGW